MCRRIPVNLPATGQLRGGLRCRSEDLCRDSAITLQEFHGVAVGILDENGANSEIKRFIGRGNVAPMRLIDSELIRAQAVSQKQAGDLFEPSDFQSEVSRRVNFFKVGAGRHQVNRKMIPCEKPVWLLFAGCETKNSDIERFCAVHIFDRNADMVQAFDKQLVLPRRHQLRRNSLIGHGLEKWKPVFLICYSANAVLRHHLIVLKRRLHGRVRLQNQDRWFFIQLYRWFPSILRVLTIPPSQRRRCRRSSMVEEDARAAGLTVKSFF
jgi:hypothetical protein